MPFTLAHPAAAVPLRRVLGPYAVLSALVIGSLTPDLAYFLPLRIPRSASHSAAALFWFCLPMGLAAYLVFHTFLKGPLIGLLPTYLRRRVLPLADLDGRLPAVPFAGVVVSLMAGATTHVLWDAFTHTGAPAVRRLGALAGPLLPGASHPEFGENALQLASTALGFLLLAIWSLDWLRSAVPCKRDAGFVFTPRLRAQLLVLMLVVWGILTFPSAVPLLHGVPTASALEYFLARAAVTGSSASVIALIPFGVLWRISQADRLRASPGSDGALRQRVLHPGATREPAVALIAMPRAPATR
jgi:hypothetical protein